MKRLLLLATPALMLTACGGDGNNAIAPVETAAPVAAAPPPAGRQCVDVVERTAEGGFRMGNPNAPVKLIEYGSRTCPHCAEFAETAMAPLRSEFIASGKVSYEYRDFLRNGADLAASLLGACGGPDTFFPMLEAMFANQPATMQRLQALPESFGQQLANTPVTGQAAAFAEAGGYLDFVKQRGIPDAQARQCIANQSAIDALSNASETAMRERNVQGTPAFFINGRLFNGPGTWEAVSAALRSAGAR